MAKKVSYSQLQEVESPGVYYSTFFKVGSIRIVGRCPHLNGANECINYENRPPDCSRLQVGSQTCSEFRRYAEVTPAEVVK